MAQHNHIHTKLIALLFRHQLIQTTFKMIKPADIFDDRLDDIPEFTNPNPRKITRDSEYNIYPICKLEELIRKIKAEQSIRTIRFLVDCDGKMWFAEEGAANAYIPAHYQMTGNPSGTARCIAAGNLQLSADYKKLIMMNHKSGDFRPTLDSLKWPLAFLIANESAAEGAIQLATDLTIEQLSPSGAPTGIYTLSKSDLTTWVLKTFARDKLTDQPKEIKKVSYESPHNRFKFHASSNKSGESKKARRLDYESEHELELEKDTTEDVPAPSSP